MENMVTQNFHNFFENLIFESSKSSGFFSNIALRIFLNTFYTEIKIEITMVLTSFLKNFKISF